MLVCNVSQGARRAAIAADIAEIAAAVDSITQGHVVFAALVDDPANVLDRVDAFNGQIMLEAASATSTVNAGLAYGKAIAEAATAADVSDASVPVVGAVAETASAANTQDASIVSGFVSTTWNPADKTSNITLSGGNLVATATGLNGGVRAIAGHGTGKIYFECTMSVWASSTTTLGIGLSTAGLNSGWVGSAVLAKSGTIWVNGSSTGVSMGTRAQGDIIGVAVDLGANLIWFRASPSGQWNAGGSANPATGIGGVSISAISGTQYPIALIFSSGDQITANFGASAFSGAVPSGFTAGWG